jgi:hypothetical protein
MKIYGNLYYNINHSMFVERRHPVCENDCIAQTFHKRMSPVKLIYM